MLVVFVVGIIAALAMPNIVFQDNRQRLEQSARELLTLMELQGEEAILTGTQRGLRLDVQTDERGDKLAYQWLQWSADEVKWLVAADQGRRLDGAVQGATGFDLLIDGQPVVAEEPPASDAEETLLPTPQIVLYASGDITNFELVLHSTDAQGLLTLRGGYEGLSLDDGSVDASKK